MALIYRRLERGLRKTEPQLRKEALVLAGFVQAYWKLMPIAKSSPTKWERVPVVELQKKETVAGKSSLVPVPVVDKHGRQEYSPNYLKLAFESIDGKRVTISLEKTTRGVHRVVTTQEDERNSLKCFDNIYELLWYLDDRLVLR